ncbi:hypothetical protein ACQ4LE_009105 [Meloidogyne hapla]
MKIKKINLPIELSFEIIKFIPFNLKWSEIRVSHVFDFFIFKVQRKFIINLKIIRQEITNSLQQIVNKYTNDFFFVENSVAKLYMGGMICRFEGIPTSVRKICASLYPIIQIPDVPWPVYNAKAKKGPVFTCFDVRRNSLISIFQYLLRLFTAIDVSTIDVSTLKAFLGLFQAQLSEVESIKIYGTSNMRGYTP